MFSSFELLDHYIRLVCIMQYIYIYQDNQGRGNLKRSKDRIYSEKGKKNNRFRNGVEDKSVAFWSGFGKNSGGEWKKA